MTTLYLFHPWIEASETGDTVLSLFGQWWDGDEAASGTTPWLYRQYSTVLGAGLGAS